MAGKMFHIDVILVADELEQFCIRQQMHFFGDRPWPGVCLGIIDSDLNIHVPQIFPAKTLDDM